MISRCFTLILKHAALVFVVMIGVGCSSPPAPSLSSTTSTAIDKHPAGYPEPQNNSASSAATPTLDPNRSVITGVLLSTADGTARPIAHVSIYLAEALKDAAGIERVASYSPMDSPRAFTDAEGRFWFYNVKPGRYGLILDAVVQGFLLSKPGTEESLLIDAKAGQITDLGNLSYDSLPVPPAPNMNAPQPNATPTGYP